MATFSKEKFKKAAPKAVQRQLTEEHVNILDGMEVIFDNSYGPDGHIKQYFVNGLEYHLYPVYKSWCNV